MINDIQLDETIHQPIRTKIIALLVNNGKTEYKAIKKNLGLSDGHMTTHMRALLKVEYVAMQKEFINNKPKTSYNITQLGKDKFNEYIKSLQAIIQS